MALIDEIDHLQIYGGDDFYINPHLTVRQPTLGEIKRFGEQKYYRMLYTLCSVGADLKWQLYDLDIDYTTVADFDLFCQILSCSFTVEHTRMILGDIIDFSKMKLIALTDMDENALVQETDNGLIIFDRRCYSYFVAALRYMHGLKRNDEMPGTESTKLVLIEDARENFELNKDKPFHSVLLPMISTMVNSEGFKHDEVDVFNMKICPFMDSVKRIGKIKQADVLLQSAYSGFGVDIKKIDKEELNYMAELR